MNPRLRGLIFLILVLGPHLQIIAKVTGDASETISNDNIADSTSKTSSTDLAAETHEFQAEIGRLMDIIIHSLYTNKEIFLREIISNASDALDKIRFLAVADPSILKELSDLLIRVEYDNEKKTISVYDSGIGMTKSELINNLGTIAKTGTTNFVEALAQGQSLNLIGQFGVGFYSTFLAGNKVTVVTKHNNDDQYIWESSAASSFSVKPDPEGNTLGRGTKIIIDLKQDAYEFCDENKLRELISKYSEFINFPIYLRVQKEVSKEVVEEDSEEPTPETTEKKDDLEIKDEDEVKKPKTKTVTEKVWEWELVNDNKAIWLRGKDNISTDEYNKFYQAITKDSENPLAHIHFNAEGDVDFKSILFIPGHAPSDLYENYYAKVSALKLYVRRVLINEKFEDLLPKYLNFVKGVIDSDDLPINVSRESLQQLKMLKVISRKLVKKALEMVKKLAEAKEDDEDDEDDEGEDETDSEDTAETQKDETKEETEEEAEKRKEKERKRQERLDKYKTFWKEFGKNIKLGIIEDAANRSKLAQLTRWYTSYDTSEYSSFDDYISRMKPNQEHIYYIGGESKESLLKYPTIQSLLKRGYEVILLEDPVDEFCLQNVYDYEKKMLVNVGKGTFIMPTDDETEKRKLKKLKKMYEPLTNWWKDLLKEKLDVVTVSERLVDDPCVVVGSVYGYSPYMEKVQSAQAYGPQNPMLKSKKNLEVNPNHPIIKELLKRVESGADSVDDETKEMATLLYDAALLNSGYSLSNPREFTTKFFKIFNPAMGIAKDAQVEEVHVELDENDTAEDAITPVSGTPVGEGYSEEIGSNSIKIDFGEPPAGKNRKAQQEEPAQTSETGEDSGTRTTRIPTEQAKEPEDSGRKEVPDL